MNAFLLAFMLLQSSGAGTLRGTVVSGEAEAVYDARVELSGPRGTLIARTDREGRFAFAELVIGTYRVAVKKESFVRASGVVVIEPGKPVQEIAIHLQPAGTILGEVRNEDGTPVANILVQALRRSYNVRGEKVLTLFSNTLTDDLGAYRLYWLDPGDYYVNASYLPQLPTAVNPNEDAPRTVYGQTYFPGTPDPSQAQLVHLDRTGGRATSFKLQRAPAVSVSGDVYSVAGGGTRARVTLMALDQSGSTLRYSTQADSKGFFEMQGVTAGTYLLAAKAVSDEQVGYSKIQVLDVDRPRADVVVGPGVSVGVRMFGDVPPSADLRSVRVSLLPVESYISAASSSVQPNGALTLTNVQPSEYALSVSGLPETGYVKEARSDSRDVLEDLVTLQYDSVSPLDIQLAFDGGQIAGSAMNAAGQPVDEATVVLVPDLGRRHRPDQYRVASSGTDGKFSLIGIPPGAYKLFAWDSIDPNAWMNADFMRDYEEFGAAVTVGADAKISAQVRVVFR